MSTAYKEDLPNYLNYMYYVHILANIDAKGAAFRGLTLLLTVNALSKERLNLAELMNISFQP